MVSTVRIRLGAFMPALVASLLLLLSACYEAESDDVAFDDETCGVNIEKQREKLGVPGLSVAVVKDGRTACTAVAGMANIEENRPVRPETLFVWASVSKTVTAAAVMALVDDGALDLDHDINEYLSFAVRNPRCPNEPITTRQLLSHTSSIREDEYEGVYADHYVQGDSPVDLGTFLKDYLTPSGKFYSKKNFKKKCPGKAYDYSNIGAGLLGHLVEAIAGMPFERFTEERLFQPLGMTTAAWRLADLNLDTVAMPYKGKPSSGFKPAGHIGFPTYPDGLLRASPSELARFLTMFIQFGELDGMQVMSHQSVMAMRAEQFPEVVEGQGLIWYYESIGSRHGLLGHTGTDPGTSSMMYFDPEDGAGVLLVANGEWNWDRAETLAKKLFKQLRTS
ncbi:MAG: beta-lactamase family protein [Alphaproteobacteria bacterium]|nr:beta-lactamase family protein [Alphaproteobacteria bacterium]